jgi:hypothetical protein
MPIPGVTVEAHPPGSLPERWQVGDDMLVSAGHWHHGRRGWVPPFSKLIQIGQGFRFRGSRAPFAHWNHSVWVWDGTLIEVSGARVRTSPFEKYREVEFVVVHSNLTDAERADADAFVRYALAKHPSFGFFTIMSVTVSLLTGLKFSFGIPGTLICSGLVAAALAAPEWREDPSHVMPGDLAEYADVMPLNLEHA